MLEEGKAHREAVKIAQTCSFFILNRKGEEVSEREKRKKSVERERERERKGEMKMLCLVKESSLDF